MIEHIIDGVYISDAVSVISSTQLVTLVNLKVQRVLTVSAMPIDESKRVPDIQYCFLFAMDMPNQDLLGDNLLEDAVQYVEKAVRDGVNVLVHCEMGVSRSVAVICAYLMRRFECTPNKALAYVKEKRANAQPNVSFMRQLDIFYQLDWKADPHSLAASPLYRNFCADVGLIPQLRPSVSDISSEPNVAQLVDESIQQRITASLDPNSPEVIAAQFRYKCRKCRSDLFYDTHTLHHARGSPGTTGQPDPDMDGGQGGETFRNAYSLVDRCGFELFVTPMKWMQVGEFQGKINCPNCNEKLGQYSWGGKKCIGAEGSYCGTYVCPWFHVHKNKVDKGRVKQCESLPPNCAIPTVVFN